MDVLGLVWVFLAVVFIAGIWLWGTYNGLVTLNERVSEAWSDITVQLKRRADLIPNLVSTVQGYAKHEKDVFTDVTAARAATVSPAALASPAAAAKAESGLQSTMKSLFAVAEAYPELKANQGFLDLQAELGNTEDKIMASRRFYNAGVRDFNIKIKQFPQTLFVAKLGFTVREFFEVADQAAIQEPPQVKF
jgi:LemA protein